MTLVLGRPFFYFLNIDLRQIYWHLQEYVYLLASLDPITQLNMNVTAGDFSIKRQRGEYRSWCVHNRFNGWLDFNSTISGHWFRDTSYASQW